MSLPQPFGRDDIQVTPVGRPDTVNFPDALKNNKLWLLEYLSQAVSSANMHQLAIKFPGWEREGNLDIKYLLHVLAVGNRVREQFGLSFEIFAFLDIMKHNFESRS